MKRSHWLMDHNHHHQHQQHHYHHQIHHQPQPQQRRHSNLVTTATTAIVTTKPIPIISTTAAAAVAAAANNSIIINMKNPVATSNNIDAIQQHFITNNNNSSSQQRQHPTVTTTTAAQTVLTVVAPSNETTTTDMISSQPVVVQVSSGGATNQPQYISVSSANGTSAGNGVSAADNTDVQHNGSVVQTSQQRQASSQQQQQQNTPLKMEDSETSASEATGHPGTYEDYGSVYSNGSNSTGHMAVYYEPYQATYYPPTTTLTPAETAYLVMEQSQHQHPGMGGPGGGGGGGMPTTNPNGLLSHRDTAPNIIPDDDYSNKSSSASYQPQPQQQQPQQSQSQQHQPVRMSVQPQTVSWLQQNYETADGVSLPRSTLYSHYQDHCEQNRIEPVNAASFGKLIRSVFVNLRTRRLGTRGNSKYHYYGIRVKPDSALNDSTNGTIENSTTPPVKRSKVNNSNNSMTSNKNNGNHNHTHHQQQQQQQLNDLNNNNSNLVSKESLQSHLGDAQYLLDTVWPSSTLASPTSISSTSTSTPSSSSSSLSSLASSSSSPTTTTTTTTTTTASTTAPNTNNTNNNNSNNSNNNNSNNEQDEMQKIFNNFVKNYRAHYDKIIRALSELSFHEIEAIWMTFWQPNSITITNLSTTTSTTTAASAAAATPPTTNGQPELTNNNHNHQLQYESDQLSLENLKELTKTDIRNWIAQTDYTMYNSIISNLLLPNLLKPIPQVLTQQIRNFAKSINKWMLNALQGYSDEFIRIKTSAVSALSHMLRRYTSLNHLSTAACAVLKNQQQVTQMMNDLNKVDFKNVQEQASWVCQCDEMIVHQVENSFKEFLQGPNPWERWSQWCEQVLDMSLPNQNISAAKQFFFKWEFYSSLVMRDLTLRSAQSFGSFHLIRLLFDEYIFYLVEQRIAKTTGTTALQMLGELASSGSTTSTTSTSSTSSAITSTTMASNTTMTNLQQQQHQHQLILHQQQQQQQHQRNIVATTTTTATL